MNPESGESGSEQTQEQAKRELEISLEREREITVDGKPCRLIPVAINETHVEVTWLEEDGVEGGGASIELYRITKVE